MCTYNTERRSHAFPEQLLTDSRAALDVSDLVLLVESDGENLAHVDDHTSLRGRCAAEIMSSARDRNRQLLVAGELEGRSA